jgi:hypothetical protein
MDEGHRRADLRRDSGDEELPEGAMSRRHGVAVAVVAAASLVAAETSPAAELMGLADSLVLQFRAPASPAERVGLMRSLAEVVEVPRVRVDPGQDVGTLLKQQCGGLRPEEMGVLRELNPHLVGAVPIGTEVALPPCPFWTGRARVSLSPDTSVEELLEQEMGPVGDDTLTAIQQLNPALDIRDLKAGDSIVLPYTTRPVSYRVKPEFAERVHEINSMFRRASRHVDGTVRTGLHQVQPVILKPADGGDGDPCTAPSPPGWPFDVEALLEVIGDNQRARGGPARPAVVAIADTGIERDETRLPLHRTPNEGTSDTYDGDGNDHPGDQIGVNLAAASGFPSSFPEDRNHAHGIHVAGLVAGRGAGPELAATIDDLVRLKILSLIGVVKVEIGADGAPERTLSMPTGGPASAATYASSVGAHILNLSVESDGPMPDFMKAMRQSTTLAVVAAGNSSQNLDAGGQRVYPAYYAQWDETRRRVIAVGAHGPDGMIASFSNYGTKSVDLLAPGVCINSLLPGGKEGRWSGTSQAAPLLSFTAALLANEWLSAEMIKRRVLNTVDVERGLPVASEGRLNVVKAVACHDDLVEVEGRGLLRGRLAGDTYVTIGDQSVAASRIERLLTRYDPASAAPMKAWVRRPTGEIDVRHASVAAADTLTFRVRGAARAETFALSAVHDLIPQQCRAVAD